MEFSCLINDNVIHFKLQNEKLNATLIYKEEEYFFENIILPSFIDKSNIKFVHNFIEYMIE